MKHQDIIIEFFSFPITILFEQRVFEKGPEWFFENPREYISTKLSKFLIEHATVDQVKEWHEEMDHEDIVEHINILIHFMSLEEIMRPFRSFTGKAWWDDVYENEASRRVFECMNELDEEHYNIEVYLYCLKHGVDIFPSDVYLDILYKMCELPDPEKKFLVDQYTKMNSNHLCVASDEFKKKMGLSQEKTNTCEVYALLENQDDDEVDVHIQYFVVNECPEFTDGFNREIFKRVEVVRREDLSNFLQRLLSTPVDPGTLTWEHSECTSAWEGYLTELCGKNCRELCEYE